MSYRFASDPTSAQLSTAVETLRAALPPGSITSSINYLLVRSIFNVVNQVLIGILVAFSIFALAATVAIVANLVTGIVISAYREIGIMKANAAAPRGHSGRWIRRLASGLGLPRPLVLGVGDAAARPLRATLTAVAVLLGVATVVIALGETRHFAAIYPYEAHVGAVDVVVSKSSVLTALEAMR